MIKHISFGVADFVRSTAFFDQAFAPLGVSRLFDVPEEDSGGPESNRQQLIIAVIGEKCSIGQVGLGATRCGATFGGAHSRQESTLPARCRHLDIALYLPRAAIG